MMRRTILFLLVVSLAVGSGVVLASSAPAKAQAIEGTLVDTKCYLAMGAKTNDHGSMKNCGSLCAKGGNPVGVVTADGKYYTLGVSAPAVADYVGQTVRASGTVKSGVILPDKVEVKKGNSWQEIKTSPMK